MPRKAQVLDVVIQPVADALDERLRSARKLRALAIVAEAAQQGQQQHGRGREPQRVELLRLQQRQKRLQKRRERRLLCAEDGVHRQADDLRREGIEYHPEAGAQQGHDKIVDAAAQKAHDELHLLPPRDRLRFHRRSLLFSDCRGVLIC